MSGRVRMTLDLSTRLDADVERLAAARQTSKADILWFAVELLTSAMAAKEAGMTVGAWLDGNGTRVEREFVGL